MARCALVYPCVGLDVAAKLAGADIAWAMDIEGTVIERMLRQNHRNVPFYGDPTAFPYKMTEDEIRCDFWLTGQALGVTFALRRIAHRNAMPSRIIAKVNELIELPALIRAWHECGAFEHIEWVTEDVRWHGTPVAERQCYMIGTLKGARPVVSGTPSEVARPKLSAEYWLNGAWRTGPAFLDPATDSGDGTSYLQILRHGAVADLAKALILRLSNPPGTLPQGAERGNQFARICMDGGRMVIAKADDTGSVQLLLDNSMEQFFDVWPQNGIRDSENRLFSVLREYPPQDVDSLPKFTKDTRNAKYIMAALGIPYTWVPM